MPAGQVAEICQAAAVVFYRIKLRLNADEPEHKELLLLLTRAIEEQSHQLKSPAFNVKDIVQAGFRRWVLRS